MTARHLGKNLIHLGLGATAVPQPDFTGDLDWYDGYGKRSATDGVEGRLVSMHSFHESWDVWEMHPKGAEVVICTSGSVTLVQEIDGEHVSTQLSEGEYAINDPGVWHTADVAGPTSCVFITAGMDTQHRPR